MMSIWVLAIFFAGKSYGWVYEFTLKFKFATVYFIIAGIAIISGIILWSLDKKLNSLVVEEENVTDTSVNLN
jgi:predicted nucleic acid-binding protein